MMRRRSAERPPPNGRRRMVAVSIGLAVVLVLLAGCSSDRDVPGAGADISSDDSASPTSVDPTTTRPSTTTSTTTTTTTTTIPPTTTTTIPLVTEGAVVLVANAAGVPAAAAKLTAELAAAGYHLAKATNADGAEASLDVSKVYFLPGGEAVAGSVAEVMGGLTVAAMPTPAWIVGATAALGDATVLVMLGKDLAGKTIPGLAGR